MAADRRSIQAHYLVGTIHRLKNERDKAIAAFTEVLKLNPRAAAAQFQLAQLNLAAAQVDTGSGCSPRTRPRPRPVTPTSS